MSTERQEYSIINQMASIAAYASLHQFEIVQTYSDPAKSGLDIKRRPGLRKLIDDVVEGRADYKAILVFDVSRWGRFQDTDEAACYEFLCKRAGIKVHYCAEPFPNDGSLASTFLKLIKRTMAAEYLRELSAKVHAGQCRISANGFKAGGRPGFGLRRLLLDSNLRPKAILRDGERKSLVTERVIYTAGPEEEIRIVHEIYSMFLDQDLKIGTIARALNERGLRNGQFGPWKHSSVSAILTHPKYIGCIVFNRSSETLRSGRVRNPRDQWVLKPDSFPALVPKDMFYRVQEKLQNQVNRRSNERLLAELRTLLKKHGKLAPELLRSANGIASGSTYVTRFGSLMRAYELVGYRSPRYTAASAESRRALALVRTEAAAQLKQAFLDAKVQSVPVGPLVRIRGCGYVDIQMGRGYKTPNGRLRWLVRARQDAPKHSLVIVRLRPAETCFQDFVVLRAVPRVIRYFTLTEPMACAEGTICPSAADVVSAILACRRMTTSSRV
jgi:DNA invertase Pin-like site-specific DNA recombinase